MIRSLTPPAVAALVIAAGLIGCDTKAGKGTTAPKNPVTQLSAPQSGDAGGGGTSGSNGPPAMPPPPK